MDEYEDRDYNFSGDEPDGSANDSNLTPSTGDIDDPTKRAYWDSDEALEDLKLERSVRGDETNEALTRRLLEEAAPGAAMSIIHLAMHSGNDNTRLNAAKYITDNLLKEEGGGAMLQKWEKLVGDVVSSAELHANGGSNGSDDDSQ